MDIRFDELGERFAPIARRPAIRHRRRRLIREVDVQVPDGALKEELLAASGHEARLAAEGGDKAEDCDLRAVSGHAGKALRREADE